MERFIGRLANNTIFVAFIGILFLWTMYQIRQILFLLLISFILVIALRPLALTLQKVKLPNWLSVSLVVIATVSVLASLGTLIVNGLAGQIGTFSASLQDAVEQLPFNESISSNLDSESLVNQITGGTDSLFSLIANTVTTFIISLITVTVITIYWLLDYDKIKRYIVKKFRERKRAERTFTVIEGSFGAWIRGQLLISLIIGVLSYIVYLTIGLPAALSLAVIAGLLEVVPTLGPILAAVPAVLVGLTISPKVALITLAANIVIQQLENQLIAPKILQYVVSLHPIAIIILLFIGNILFGLIGVLLAVPVALLLISIKRGYFENKKTAS